MYVKKINHFLSNIKNDAHKRKLVPFSASRCTVTYLLTYNVMCERHHWKTAAISRRSTAARGVRACVWTTHERLFKRWKEFVNHVMALAKRGSVWLSVWVSCRSEVSAPCCRFCKHAALLLVSSWVGLCAALSDLRVIFIRTNTHIHTNVYSAKNRQNESEAIVPLQWLLSYD